MIRTLVDAKAIYEKAAGTSAANHFENGWLAALHAKTGDSPTPDEKSSGSSERAARGLAEQSRADGSAPCQAPKTSRCLTLPKTSRQDEPKAIRAVRRDQ